MLFDVLSPKFNAVMQCPNIKSFFQNDINLLNRFMNLPIKARQIKIKQETLNADLFNWHRVQSNAASSQKCLFDDAGKFQAKPFGLD